MFIDEFKSMVTTTKRNHIYYGPTESRKLASTLEEIATDLKRVYNEMDILKDSVDAVSSGYMLPSGYIDNLFDLRRKVYNFEDKMKKRIYVQSEQVDVLE